MTLDLLLLRQPTPRCSAVPVADDEESMDAPSQVRAKLCALALLPAFVSFDAITSRAAAQETAKPCVDPSGLARSVVSIAWYFDKARRGDAGRDAIGERATAFFYMSPRFLVTAAHFANDLPSHDWREVELRQASEGGPDITVRTQIRVIARERPMEKPMPGAATRAGLAQDVAILELRDPFPNAQVLQIKAEAPPKDSTVLVLGYPGGRMQAARGIVREAENPARKYPGLSFLEVQGSNRLLLNGGASGAPVLDCREGRVVGVLNGLLTGPPLSFLPEHSVIPTPWGSPTNTAVPASTLAAIRNRLL